MYLTPSAHHGCGDGQAGVHQPLASQPGQLCPLPGTNLQPLTPWCRGPPWPRLSGERQALSSSELMGPPSQGGAGAQGTPTRARMGLHASRQSTPLSLPRALRAPVWVSLGLLDSPRGLVVGASWLYGVAGGPLNLLGRDLPAGISRPALAAWGAQAHRGGASVTAGSCRADTWGPCPSPTR